MNNTKPKTKKQKQVKDLPILPICFFGHRRRKLAKHVLECLKKNLKTTGYTPKFIFGNCGKDEDYRSKVIEAIQETFGPKALHKVFDCPGIEGLGNGLNAAMNACIQEAWTLNDVCLRLEDDWVLVKPLDIGPWLDLMKSDNLAMIRLGQIQIDPNKVKPYREDLGLDWLDYSQTARYPINHQVGIIHKRLHDLLGYYSEQMNIDENEFDFGRKFRVKCKNFTDPNYPKVLWPHGQALTIDPDPNRFFIHAGISSPALQHDHFSLNIPEDLLPYQEPEDLQRLEQYKKEHLK